MSKAKASLPSFFNLTAYPRASVGKSASRRLRHQHIVPIVIYGGDKSPAHLQIEHDKIYHASRHEAFHHHILTLKVADHAEKILLKTIQYHPVKKKIMHADFQRIDLRRKITLSVPIHYLREHEAPGLKQGGTISKQLTAIEIRCLPSHIPEVIELDIAHLQINDTLHLSDIKLPSGVEIPGLSQGHEHDLAIVSMLAEKIETESTDNTEVTPETGP